LTLPPTLDEEVYKRWLKTLDLKEKEE
jgi:hypothetical protein